MPIVKPASGSKQVASVHADIGADTSGFERGAASVKGGLNNIANDADIANKKSAMLSVALTTLSAVIVTSYNEYANLAESVRDLSLVNGESAESTSRFIQVLDDYQLTAEDATAAAKKLKDNGLSPTIETLAKLSDQFRGIKDPAERMDFVYDKLGKSGGKFVNMLNQGSDALLANADAINKNLILNDLEIKMYEVGRLAIDDKVDALTAFRVELGQNIGNVLAFAAAMERATEIQAESVVYTGRASKATITYDEALNMAIAEQLTAADAAIEYRDSLKEQEEALKEVSKANAELISGAIGITESQNKFQEKQDDIIKKIQETRAEGEKLYPWEAEKIAENAAELEELGNAYFESAEQFRAAQEKKFALYAVEQIAMSDGVKGFSEAEYEKARIILETTDIATAAAFDEQQAMVTLAQAVADGVLPVENYGAVLSTVMADGKASVEEVAAAINAVPTEKNITFTLTTIGAPPNLSMSNAAAPVGTRRSSGGRAGGGSVNAGQSYLVGEQGMEMFTPSQDGTITPNHKMGAGGGSVTVNIMLDSGTPDPERVAYNLKPAVERVIREMQQAGRV